MGGNIRIREVESPHLINTEKKIAYEKYTQKATLRCLDEMRHV